MMCCVCAGSCNHVGNHSYCVAHGGSMNVGTTWTGTTVSPGPFPIFGFHFLPSVCEHCFCRDSDKIDFPPHQVCCNCGIQRAKVEAASE